MKLLSNTIIVLIFCALDSLLIWQIHCVYISNLDLGEKIILILTFSVILVLTIYLASLLFTDDEN